MDEYRFMYITDTHLMGYTPISRTDDYQQTGRRKLREILAIAKKNDITTILHGGDFFDSERPGYEVLNSTMCILNGEPLLQWYINVGNHDLFGANFTTHHKTALYSLGQLPNVHILEDDNVMQLPGTRVLIHSKWFTYEREGDPDALTLIDQSGSLLKKEQGYYSILMAHVMLVQNSFFGNYISLRNLPITNLPDLVLGSHYHPGWEEYRYRTTEGICIFANPGSLLRQAKKKDKRVPQALIVKLFTEEANKIRTVIEVYPLESADPWPFKDDAPVVDEESLQKTQFESFLKQLTMEESSAVLADPRVLVRKIAKERNYSDKVVEKVINNLALSLLKQSSKQEAGR